MWWAINHDFRLWPSDHTNCLFSRILPHHIYELRLLFVEHVDPPLYNQFNGETILVKVYEDNHKTSWFILVKTRNGQAWDGCKTTGGSDNVKRNSIIMDQRNGVDSLNPGNSLEFCVKTLNPLEICYRQKIYQHRYLYLSKFHTVLSSTFLGKLLIPP